MLHYVYLGNVPELEGNTTYCPQCGQKVIVRSGYETEIIGLDGTTCLNCGYKLAIIGL
ncbi:hypothetical protein RDV78_08185 [Bacillota bacterium LX-D]|nr:hypothetical protein [Bacillota bacterium LX-D]